MNNEMINKNNAPVCPIYFEDHRFCGHVASIEEFTNIDFGTIRTTILCSKPYFCAIDICRGLCLSVNRTSEFVSDAVNDIINEYCLTPNVETVGVKNDTMINELVFNIDVEVSHNARHGTVKQMVRTTFVAEPVLYMLIFRSRKKEAVKFKAWLAVEILPNLRMLGREKASQLLSNESGKLVYALQEVNDKYKDFTDSEAKTRLMFSSILEILNKHIMGENINNKILDAKISELLCRVDQVGFNTNTIRINQDSTAAMTADLHNNVISIATGLQMLFGPPQSNNIVYESRG